MTAALTRPNLIARGVTLLALAAAVVIVIALAQGGTSYSLKLQMTNADGIRPGSQVLLGGVPVGTVNSLNLGAHDLVIAGLSLNPKQVKVGRGTTADIIAANLLGEEYVALHPGNPRQPLPSGSMLPVSAVTVPTDLDQIIDVLDPDTQTALATLINEAGIAVAGRQSDVSAILRQLPLSAVAATKLLTQLVQDNHTLKDVIATSNQFIARVNDQRVDLGHVIDAASGAATTAALRAGDLRQSLLQAPSSLRIMQTFLAALGQTTHDLTKPAALIASSAGPLNDLLTEVKPFEQAAVPALDRAAAVAPQLTTLGEQATPIVHKAIPTLGSLDHIAKLLGPLTYWLGANVGADGDNSVQDLLGVMQGWARAIQFRDGLGHIFHSQLVLSPSVVVNLADLGLTSLAAKRANARDVIKTGVLSPVVSGLTGSAATRRPASTTSTTSATGAVGSTVSQLLQGVSGTVKSLTGAVQSVTGTGTPAPAGPATGGPPPTKTLSGLLSYLIGK